MTNLNTQNGGWWKLCKKKTHHRAQFKGKSNTGITTSRRLQSNRRKRSPGDSLNDAARYSIKWLRSQGNGGDDQTKSKTAPKNDNSLRGGGASANAGPMPPSIQGAVISICQEYTAPFGRAPSAARKLVAPGGIRIIQKKDTERRNAEERQSQASGWRGSTGGGVSYRRGDARQTGRQEKQWGDGWWQGSSRGVSPRIRADTGGPSNSNSLWILGSCKGR